MKALVRLHTVRRPLSQEILGYRLQATIPNMEARKMRPSFNANGVAESFTATKEQVPSFRQPYFIAESSDHSNVTIKEIKAFLTTLKWEGFDEWELIGKWEVVPL